MTQLFQGLEPRVAEVKEIIYNELDESSEYIFFTKGQVDIGFELNKRKYFALRLFYAIHIGGVGCSFN